MSDFVLFSILFCTHVQNTAHVPESEFSNPIRLVVNSTTLSVHEGTIEIYYNHKWNTICDENWDFPDALVACRMLGFRTVAQVYAGYFKVTLTVLYKGQCELFPAL